MTGNLVVVHSKKALNEYEIGRQAVRKWDFVWRPPGHIYLLYMHIVGYIDCLLLAGSPRFIRDQSLVLDRGVFQRANRLGKFTIISIAIAGKSTIP